MRKRTLLCILSALALAFAAVPTLSGESFDHIEQLFALRTSITNQGNILPEKIRNTSGADLRTLERIFELNTSTLTTIEAYFRLLMMALSTETESSPETVDTLNEWLTFIDNQCKYDIEYLEATLEETTDGEVIEEINAAKKNVEKLSEITRIGMRENTELMKKNAERPD